MAIKVRKIGIRNSIDSFTPLIFSNVKSSRIKIAKGKRIARQIFWVPQSGGIGMGVSILSYAGKIDFGVVTDVKRVPDPAAIVKRFTDEFEELLLMALMMPWPKESHAHGKAVSS